MAMIDSPHLLFARIKNAADIEGSYVVLLAKAMGFLPIAPARKRQI